MAEVVPRKLSKLEHEMGRETGISWTDATWNPIRGCTRVSEGCRNCYAENVAYRFSGPGGAYEGLVRIGSDGKRRREWNGEVHFVEKHLLDPLKWKEPRRIFVNSMSDLFHENASDETRDKIFAVMTLCPQHTFQILTKRPQRMADYVDGRSEPGCDGLRGALIEGMTQKLYSEQHQEDHSDIAMWLAVPWPLPNVHLGVSVENRAAKSRIDVLREVPAALRFLSLEPLLEDLGDLDLSGIGWCIVGGESGPSARPCNLEWIRSLVDRCQSAGVACWVKQMGPRPYWNTVDHGLVVTDISPSDRQGAEISEFPACLRVRQFPNKVPA